MFLINEENHVYRGKVSSDSENLIALIQVLLHVFFIRNSRVRPQS